MNATGEILWTSEGIIIIIIIIKHALTGLVSLLIASLKLTVILLIWKRMQKCPVNFKHILISINTGSTSFLSNHKIMFSVTRSASILSKHKMMFSNKGTTPILSNHKMLFSYRGSTSITQSCLIIQCCLTIQ